ncbi:hypothetical protein EYR38_010077 [Pleurotus pulmonarius]|nr:hypothetical protein EYR38_010077 [Pleurotus pulmonarius]
MTLRSRLEQLAADLADLPAFVPDVAVDMAENDVPFSETNAGKYVLREVQQLKTDLQSALTAIADACINLEDGSALRATLDQHRSAIQERLDKATERERELKESGEKYFARMTKKMEDMATKSAKAIEEALKAKKDAKEVAKLVQRLQASMNQFRAPGDDPFPEIIVDPKNPADPECCNITVIYNTYNNYTYNDNTSYTTNNYTYTVDQRQYDNRTTNNYTYNQTTNGCISWADYLSNPCVQQYQLQRQYAQAYCQPVCPQYCYSWC